MTDFSFVPWLVSILKGLYETLYPVLKAAQGADPGLAVLVLVGLSFTYGVLHILLPGHQKAVIGAYFLSENARYGQGFLAGGLFAIFHAMSATLLPFALRAVFQLSFGKTSQLVGHLTTLVAVVGIFVVALVLFLLKLKAIPELRRRAALGTMRRRMAFDLHERLETTYEPIPWRKLLPFLFFAAILPCPDTIIFLGALSRGAIVPGLAAVAAMTLGMTATLTIIALSVIAAKQGGRGVARRRGGGLGSFFLDMAGLLVLVASAIILLLIDGSAPLI